MLPADPRILFQVTAAVLGAVVLWVAFVLVRMPKRTQVKAGKKAEEPAEKAPGKNAHDHDHDHGDGDGKDEKSAD